MKIQEQELFIDHIVLIVKNINATESFYSSFLGVPESKDAESICYVIGHIKIFFVLPYSNYIKIDKDSSGINHLVFGVRDLQSLKDFEEILNKSKIKNSGIKLDSYGNKEFIYFDDLDGYRLEFYLRPKEESKDFLGWFKLKKKLDKSNYKTPLFKEGEVWWCVLGENIGIEMNGKSKKFSRPVHIFKKLSNDGFLGIPLSTKTKVGTWYVPIVHKSINSIAMISQVKVISSKRLLEKYGELDDKDIEKIKNGFYYLYLGKKFVPSEDGVVGKSQI
jgi:mRNA interferase MazF